MSHGTNDALHHMNTDHVEELLDAVRSLAGHGDATSARAESIDPNGIDLVVETPGGPTAVRLEFAEPVVDDPAGIRAAFEELTSRAHAQANRHQS